MSTRLVYQQCVDECAFVQDVVSSILNLKDEPLSLKEKRKRFEALQSDARKHLSALKTVILKVDAMPGISSENRKKIEAIENQYSSFLVIIDKHLVRCYSLCKIYNRFASSLLFIFRIVLTETVCLFLYCYQLTIDELARSFNCS